ncbi:MAG TPA: helix-turn-helix domain-containing protein, partial [Nitrolancea sp.]|nr:helix-turn-helix domain-containing protein [Nitrolancea sp.]
MSGKQALTAREAANELGISVATLYAYVSRGLIHSEPGPVGSRQRRYRLADVQALKERQAQRRDPARSVETALHWGTPLLESSITLIENNCLYYRGHNVINLARTQRFEDVVGLLWTGKHDGAAIELGENHPRERVPIELPATLSPLERIHARLPILANAVIAAYDLRPQAIMRVGRSILGALV